MSWRGGMSHRLKVRTPVKNSAHLGSLCAAGALVSIFSYATVANADAQPPYPSTEQIVAALSTVTSSNATFTVTPATSSNGALVSVYDPSGNALTNQQSIGTTLTPGTPASVTVPYTLPAADAGKAITGVGSAYEVPNYHNTVLLAMYTDLGAPPSTPPGTPILPKTGGGHALEVLGLILLGLGIGVSVVRPRTE